MYLTGRILNIMDEMTIDGVKHYAMVDPDSDEYNIVRQK